MKLPIVLSVWSAIWKPSPCEREVLLKGDTSTERATPFYIRCVTANNEASRGCKAL